jgi:hypothetical protein
MNTADALAALKADLQAKSGRSRLAAALGAFRQQARDEHQLQMMVQAPWPEPRVYMSPHAWQALKDEALKGSCNGLS